LLDVTVVEVATSVVVVVVVAADVRVAVGALGNVGDSADVGGAVFDGT
jgi:hypothetical protein